MPQNKCFCVRVGLENVSWQQLASNRDAACWSSSAALYLCTCPNSYMGHKSSHAARKASPRQTKQKQRHADARSFSTCSSCFALVGARVKNQTHNPDDVSHKRQLSAWIIWWGEKWVNAKTTNKTCARPCAQPLLDKYLGKEHFNPHTPRICFENMKKYSNFRIKINHLPNTISSKSHYKFTRLMTV